ncbi:hypothetical protein Hanom_Chr17g01569371 [Helianthus anomalus]
MWHPLGFFIIFLVVTFSKLDTSNRKRIQVLKEHVVDWFCCWKHDPATTMDPSSKPENCIFFPFF